MPASRLGDTQPSRLKRVFVTREVIGVTLGLGGVLALSIHGVLPEAARLVGWPAIAATMLLDTFLYNTFRIHARWLWFGELAVFVYIQAAFLTVVLRSVRDWFSHT